MTDGTFPERPKCSETSCDDAGARFDCAPDTNVDYTPEEVVIA
jgi:hypothetical protein